MRESWSVEIDRERFHGQECKLGKGMSNPKISWETVLTGHRIFPEEVDLEDRLRSGEVEVG